MQHRILEIATDGVHLSVHRGFLKVTREGDEIGRVAFPDIGGVIVRGYGVSVSLNLVERLSEINVPLVLCGIDQSPTAIVWPVSGHHAQADIIETQAALSRPKQKRLWQALVRAKIAAQADVLTTEGLHGEDILAMSARVRSGDPENLEAQAARRYWSRLMEAIEPSWTRDVSSGSLNGWLNYGYAVLRAATARSILAAGLHPGFSVFHRSRGEPLRLSSDLMEPFRPYIDLTVRRMALTETGPLPDLDRNRKAEIVRVLTLDLMGPSGASPVQTCLDRLAQSFASVCLGETTSLNLPSGLPNGEGAAA